MKRFIVIAGPQAAGKSTVISAINDQYQDLSALSSVFGEKKPPFLFPLQESRQIVVHTDVILGGVFMNLEQELEVIKHDLRRMDLVSNQQHDNLIYLDECNVFTIAHAKAHGLDQVEESWPEYIDRLQKLQAAVIFLDISADLSWERRHHKYSQRLVCFDESAHAEIMGRYYEYIKTLGPLLHTIYEQIPLPKIMVDASLPLKSVVQNVNKALAGFISLPNGQQQKEVAYVR